MLLPGSRDRVRCGLPARRTRFAVSHLYLARVTCQECLRKRNDRPVSAAAECAMGTTIVGGQRREILLCECAAAMIAGIDHVCDPDDRRDGGLTWT